MKTSRKDGILVMQTVKPYKMSINGKVESRNEIICKEPTSKCQNLVFEIEDLFLMAAANMPERSATEQSKAQWAKDEKEMALFNENDCPSDSEIKAQADLLALIVRTSTAEGVSTTRFIKTFEEIVKGGFVLVEGQEPMTEPRWDSVDRNDKLRIAFWYCAFFVKPLDTLQSMASSTESQGLSEVKEEPQTL